MLWAHQDQGLVRSQIYHRMALPPKERPTTHRIGQILKMFHIHDYLDREIDRFQGTKRAAFYRLNPKGKQACRERYRFDNQDQALFHVTDGVRRKYLTAENFDGSPEAQPQRVIGFYSYSPGLDQAVMVAHTASALARQAKEKEILVIDLDFETPELDRFFATSTGESNRCFRRLLTDYLRQPDWRKEQWLQEAVNESSYTFLARPERFSNLHFLRSGMKESLEDPTVAVERGSVLDHLKAELKAATGDDSQSGEACFLQQFRSALLDRYDLVLVCSQSGRSVGALAMIQLVDQLVLNAHATESQPTLGGLRAVAAWFLRAKRAARQIHPGIIMALHLSEYSSGAFDGIGWLRDKILCPVGEGPLPEKSPWILRYNRLLDTPTNWRATKVFVPFAKRLLDPQDQQDPMHPVVKAVDTLLNPNAQMDYRTMMAASLENADFGTFSQSVNAWLGDEEFEQRTDEAGLEMLKEVFDQQQRKIFAKLGG